MMTTLINAKDLFQSHLLDKVSGISEFSHKSLSECGLEEKELENLKLTHFDDIYDTLLYSKLIQQALELNPQVKKVIDLGAGSSIPTLLAIKNAGRRHVQTLAVDIDPEARSIGHENARILGLSNNYSFHQQRMEDAIMDLGPFDETTLIVSNPPYIATPSHLQEKFFIPVNGGVYGDHFLLKILNQHYMAGVNLALLWGSLTSPREVLPVINSKFDLIHTEAHRIHFGNYTTKEPLRTHLYRLRDQGDVFFENDDVLGEVQLVFGTILRSRRIEQG